MARILVLFATFDGQTKLIAERIGAALAKAGHAVTTTPVESHDAGELIERHDAVIVGGAVRYGHYKRDLVRLAHERAQALGSRPSAFFSVCMSARDPIGNRALIDRYVDEFREATGWWPGETASFGGALLYRRYNPLLRLVMRLISWAAGGDTDTSRDYEYTKWEEVEGFAKRFGAGLQVAAAA